MQESMTLSTLQANSDLWYQIRVLLYDLSNVATDPLSHERTGQTTDPIYISSPYFSDEEAALVKDTIISPPMLNEVLEFETLNIDDEVNEQSVNKS